MSRELRSWREIPALLLAGAGLLTVQILWHAKLAAPQSVARPLPAAPPLPIARSLAFGDPVTSSKLLMLWLQAFDTQAGHSLALHSLDYERVIAWLNLSLALDPLAQYPLLAASRLYAEVPDPKRSRRMLEFVEKAFADDPAQRWPWLAHAVYLARHRLQDSALALRFAQALAANPAPEIPHWARQLEIFVLEDRGEIEAAKILLGGLLASGKIADPHERWFLSQRLHALEVERPPLRDP
ncbi:MAG: hypothetical protein ACREXT_07105 [Gammaproteobacteria bacterium]